jgi:hypothetical protein
VRWFACVLLCVAVGCGGSDKRADQALPMAREPYMGIACGIPNSIACDRVGLAVWLKAPVRRVRAQIGGRWFVLGERLAPRAGQPREWRYSGFLQPAGMLVEGPLHVVVDRKPDFWQGSHPVTARVRVVVERRDGGRATTSLPVSLHAGWG